MNKKDYKQLSEDQIEALKSNGCNAENWNTIFFLGEINPFRFRGCYLSGEVYIGKQNETVTLFGNVKKTCGIYFAHIHNCTIGNNVYINHIKNYIANYIIEDNVVIDNTDMCAIEGVSTFGNGSKVNVLDETGGRKVPIYDKLSAHMAYILAFYKHRSSEVNKLEALINQYTKRISSSYGTIGHNSQIFNCRIIKNVRTGPYTFINGASILENGSVNSNQSAPVIIGHDAILKNFIVSSGSEVSDGAIVSDCFIGQGCILSSQYSAQNSLFFANCQGFHGEACSIFAGPYTVTHHKSTLLIAGMFSFCNAGSGSNQSNHMYKLGPIHHGIVERGSKTTSDSYLLWPARIGAFTMVMGRHYKNSDTSNMPFSYLIENNDESWLVPGINLRSVGTIRDVMKWPKRDKRIDPEKLDCINFNLLSPFTIQKMANAIDRLHQIKNISGEITEVYSYNNTKIKSDALNRGIELYHLAITKFIGNSIITRLNKCDLPSIKEVSECLKATSDVGKGDWIDLSGLIAPKSEIENLLSEIENDNIYKLDEIEKTFSELHNNYYEYEWNWTVDFIKNYLKKEISKFTIDELIDLIKKWRESVVKIDKMLYADASKEFRLNTRTAFGIDGDKEIKQQDFDQVRGRFEDNDFVKETLNHIERKTELGNTIISRLKKAKNATVSSQ